LVDGKVNFDRDGHRVNIKAEAAAPANS
jgi:hypothetical protein